MHKCFDFLSYGLLVATDERSAIEAVAVKL